MSRYGKYKQATTPTEKYNNAYCDRCEFYWLRETNETCINPKNETYYGKKKKVGSMVVCDFYEPLF